ncbi:hypothetical protein GTO10_06790 [Candidatus Saccharibacteria bacterium]|nr:hypothetical protein [Candidatus Saccharibacteria bacterium]
MRTINKKYFPENKLIPIVGGGQADRPKLMFVFINPTHRNISSDPNWEGPRYPFIGTREVWRVFYKAGFLADNLMRSIEKSAAWPVSFAKELEEFMKRESLYITNLVKRTGSDASLPDAGMTKLFIPVIQREIELVQPTYIVSFGLIPFERLTGRKIKLGDYYLEVVGEGSLKAFDLSMGSNLKPRVIPCYFPVGRGNPARAVEILKLLHDL